MGKGIVPTKFAKFAVIVHWFIPVAFAFVHVYPMVFVAKIGALETFVVFRKIFNPRN